MARLNFCAGASRAGPCVAPGRPYRNAKSSAWYRPPYARPPQGSRDTRRSRIRWRDLASVDAMQLVRFVEQPSTSRAYSAVDSATGALPASDSRRSPDRRHLPPGVDRTHPPCPWHHAEGSISFSRRRRFFDSTPGRITSFPFTLSPFSDFIPDLHRTRSADLLELRDVGAPRALRAAPLVANAQRFLDPHIDFQKDAPVPPMPRQQLRDRSKVVRPAGRRAGGYHFLRRALSKPRCTVRWPRSANRVFSNLPPTSTIASPITRHTCRKVSVKTPLTPRATASSRRPPAVPFRLRGRPLTIPPPRSATLRELHAAAREGLQLL